MCISWSQVLQPFICGSRAFRISAPKIWNFLPPHILQFQTLLLDII